MGTAGDPRNMNPIKPTLIVSLSSWLLAASLPTRADTIQLADGTVLNGELAPPVEVVVKTVSGDRKVAFALLPVEMQAVYWAKAADLKSEAQPPAGAPVSDEEIAGISNEVNLKAWSHVATISSFRDKPEKRDNHGLLVAKAFNAIDENWAAVYSPKDAVGQTGNWSGPLTKARAMEARPVQSVQKRWLDTFIKAAEAVAARDSGEFSAQVRELKRTRIAAEIPRNFFTAK